MTKKKYFMKFSLKFLFIITPYKIMEGSNLALLKKFSFSLNYLISPQVFVSPTKMALI